MTRPAKRFPAYSHLLKLYPQSYQHSYREQMLQTLADMVDNAPDGKARAAIWARIAIDFPRSLFIEHVKTTGEIMLHETPSYVKRNALLGGLLLVPFMTALVANSLDKLLYNHSLYSSWLWHAPILAIWVLWLPLGAVLIASFSLAVFLLRRVQSSPHSRFKILFDIRQDWPLIMVAAGALLILAILFGHDSAHCIAGNPIREIRNPQQTWRCIQQGAANYPFQHPVTFLKRAFGL